MLIPTEIYSYAYSCSLNSTSSFQHFTFISTGILGSFLHGDVSLMQKLNFAAKVKFRCFPLTQNPNIFTQNRNPSRFGIKVLFK